MTWKRKRKSSFLVYLASDLYICTERGNLFKFFLQGSTFQWCNDTGKDAEESLLNTSFQSYLNADCLVPDKDPDSDPKLHHGDNKNETLSQNPVVTEGAQIFPKVPHEFCSQHRDSAITRYKEKRKSRRQVYFSITSSILMRS